MAMRTDCKHYESRSYASGETVRKCRLDLAPEAPWRCPADCPSYSRRMVDVGWDYGSLRESVQQPPAEPVELGDDVARLLDEAEDIVHAASLDVASELDRPTRKGLFRKVTRRRKKR